MHIDACLQHYGWECQQEQVQSPMACFLDVFSNLDNISVADKSMLLLAIKKYNSVVHLWKTNVR